MGARTGITKKCSYCGKEFYTPLNRLKNKRGKYCSKPCSYKARFNTEKLKNKEWLQKESEIKPMHQIAKELPCNMATIQRWRNKFNIHYKVNPSTNPEWKPRKMKMKEGYLRVHINKQHPYYKMADRAGHILEHRLVMAQHLGRCLDSWEIIHHKNGKRDDNRIENLEFFSSQGTHLSIMLLQKEVKRLKERVTLLEMENQLLKDYIEVG